MAVERDDSRAGAIDEAGDVRAKDSALLTFKCVCACIAGEITALFLAVGLGLTGWATLPLSLAIAYALVMALAVLPVMRRERVGVWTAFKAVGIAQTLSIVFIEVSKTAPVRLRSRRARLQLHVLARRRGDHAAGLRRRLAAQPPRPEAAAPAPRALSAASSAAGPPPSASTGTSSGSCRRNHVDWRLAY